MILYLTGNECFSATTPISNLTKSMKGGWLNGPALHPAATSLARYSVMTSGLSKANKALYSFFGFPGLHVLDRTKEA